MNIMNKEIKTKICTKCGRELSIDSFYKDNRAKNGLQCWCKVCKNEHNQANKEHYSQYHNQYYKEWQKQFKGYYLYIILDKQGNIVYVGQTKNYYTRLCQHLSENVNSTKELFNNGNWSCIKYLDVEHIVENDMELKALENELIELYEPRCNTKLNIIHDIDRGRLFNLLAQLHGILNEWIVFKENI